MVDTIQSYRENIVFDLGFYNGLDSLWYLEKGYQVVAVEANPELAERGARKLEKFICAGQITIVNAALSERDDDLIDFFINDNMLEWSSCNKLMAESDGSNARVVSVRSITLMKLIETFGLPYYVKSDIEGNDGVVARQLLELPKKPQYVSFEIGKKNYYDILPWLYVSGYSSYQLINQLHTPKGTSGAFGEYLDDDNWISFDKALERYVKYKLLKEDDNVNLAVGWIDIHAKL